jgi:hypothetical protein
MNSNNGESDLISKDNPKSFQSHMRKLIMNKLFKINHVLLDNQPVNSSFFHLILLFEFI